MSACVFITVQFLCTGCRKARRRSTVPSLTTTLQRRKSFSTLAVTSTSPIRYGHSRQRLSYFTESGFSYPRTPTTWHCPHSPAARRCCTAIDRYLLPAGPTAANLQRRVCCRGFMLDRRTDTVPFRRPCSRAVPITVVVVD